MKAKFYLLFINLFIGSFALATHNRAGEIQYEQIDQLTIRATVITYTKTSSTAADRDSLTLCWGDGTCTVIGRVNGPNMDGTMLGNDIKRNEYVAEHTYSSVGNYMLSMRDPNRNGGILNINSGFSEEVLFYLETEVFLGEILNDSPVFLQPPVDIGYIDIPFYHHPNAFDPDGDSIAYELITPLKDNNESVPNYQSVTEIGASPNNTLELDELTGLISWVSPQIPGEYNLTIAVKTYQNGELNGIVIRDMQITILEEMNFLPEIEVSGLTNNTTIETQVGETVQFLVLAEKQDASQELELTSSSELYLLENNQPEFTILNETSTTIEGQFTWTVSEEAERGWSYQVVFKISDNTGLANFFTVRIQVGEAVNTFQPNALETVKLFPNPTTDWLFLDNQNFENKVFSVWDEQGRKIQDGRINGNTKVSVKDLPKGKYVFVVEEKMVGLFIKL